MKTIYSALALLSGVLFVHGTAFAESPLKVVTTLTAFSDITKTIGGDLVEVKAIASPRFNPHFIEPTPGDVLRVKRADLFIHAGLDLELWRYPLLDAAGNTEMRSGGERELDMSRGIRLLKIPDHPVSRSEGDIHIYGNPHYWLDPENGKVMARAIAAKLSELDSEHHAVYEKNLAVFLANLSEREIQWRQKGATCRGKEIVAYHDQWVYLTDFLGLKNEEFLEPKPGIPPTPKQLSFLQDYIRTNHISAVVQASFDPEEGADALARETGVKKVILCQNVGELADKCPDFIATLDYDLGILAESVCK